MNLRLCLYIVGTFLQFLGVLMLIPFLCSMIYREGDEYYFLLTALITAASGLLLKVLNKEAENINELGRKEAFIVAFLCWIVASLYGSLPYLFTSIFSNPVDAWFESVAGFTTTGASVINDLAELPRAYFFTGVLPSGWVEWES